MSRHNVAVLDTVGDARDPEIQRLNMPRRYKRTALLPPANTARLIRSGQQSHKTSIGNLPSDFDYSAVQIGAIDGSLCLRREDNSRELPIY